MNRHTLTPCSLTSIFTRLPTIKIGRSSRDRTLTKSFGDSYTTIILNSYNKRKPDSSNSLKCSPKTSTAINLFILTFNESATQCNPDKTNYMLYILHKEKPYS